MSSTPLQYARPEIPPRETARRRTILAAALTLACVACEGFAVIPLNGRTIPLTPILLLALCALGCGTGGCVYSILALRVAGSAVAKIVPALTLLVSVFGTGVAFVGGALAAMFYGYHGC